MSKALTRNVALFGGMIAAGFMCARAFPPLMSIRGDHGPTVMTSQRPVVAGLVLLACLLGATLLACVVGRLVNAAVGLFVLGAGVFALDDRLAGVRELVFANPDRSAIYCMATEAIVLGLTALVMVKLVFMVTGGFHDVEPQADGTKPHWLTNESAIKSAAAAILVLPAIWLIAQTPLKGQAIAAVFIGATLAGLIGRLVAPHVQPVLVFVAPMLFGAVGYVAAGMMSKPPLDQAYISGTLSVFASVMPLDYLAGSLMGVSFGLGWAKSFLHHEESPAAAKA